MHDFINTSCQPLSCLVSTIGLSEDGRKEYATMTGTSKYMDMDADCDPSLMAGIVDDSELPDLKKLGTMLNPFFQCNSNTWLHG